MPQLGCTGRNGTSGNGSPCTGSPSTIPPAPARARRRTSRPMAPTASGPNPSLGGSTIAVSAEDNRAASYASHPPTGDFAQIGRDLADRLRLVRGADDEPGHERQGRRGHAGED